MDVKSFSDEPALRSMRDRYRRDLFERFLPFVDEFMLDRRAGGFFCSVDPNGVLVDDRKHTWFVARGAWVYSHLYRHHAPDPDHLGVARAAIDFLLDTEPSSGDPWPQELSRDGVPLVPGSGDVYGDLFVAEALAEFALASGEEHHWAKARSLALRSVRRYDEPDYDPTVGQTYLGAGAPPLPGARVLGVWMVLLRVVTQMLEARSDAELETVADRCVDTIIGHHLNPRFGLLNELLRHDLTRPDDEYEQLVYTGHAIETLWMLMAEASRRGDDGLFGTAANWFRRHVEVAWDDVYGGAFANLRHVDDNVWLTDKLLWVQEEILIGALMVIERTDAAWAQELFDRTDRHVQQTYPLYARGSSVWMHATDRHGSYESFAERPARVENYHHPRQLMIGLTVLERLLARVRAQY